MYAPPRSLCGANLPDLISAVGGSRAALALLDVTDRTLRRWLEAGDAPTAVLRLLWYASSQAREAAAADLAHALHLTCLERDALARELDLASALLAVAAAAPATPTRYARRPACNDPMTPEILAAALALNGGRAS